MPRESATVKPIAVARRYARALADVAQEQDPRSLDKVAAEVSLVAQVLDGEAAIGHFFDDPSVPAGDKEAAATTLGRKAHLGPLTRRFVDVLIENGRLGMLPAIAPALRAIRDDRLGMVPAEATMAKRPSPAELRKFRAALEKMTGRTVRLTVKVDPDVLGGARTRVGSQVYDGTLKRQLAVLRRRLAEAR